MAPIARSSSACGVSRKPAIAGSLLLGDAGVVVLAAAVLHIKLGREPFRMIVRESDGSTVVQFAKPHKNQVSPDFAVDLEIEAPFVVHLKSPETQIPGGTIQFAD